MTTRQSNITDNDNALEVSDTVRTKKSCPRCGGHLWIVDIDGANDSLLLRCLGDGGSCVGSRDVPEGLRPTTPQRNPYQR